MLVTLALSVLLMAALVELYRGYSSLFVLEQLHFTLGTSANRAMTGIQDDARQARQVLASHAISGTTYTTGASTLVLELPSVDAGGTVIAGAFDYAVFYIS